METDNISITAELDSIPAKLSEQVERRVKALYSQHKMLTSEIVIADARNPESPFHATVNWDKDDVHERYLKMWASNLLTKFKIPVYTSTDPRVRAREFPMVSVQVAGGIRKNVRLALPDIKQSPEQSRQVISGIVSRLINDSANLRNHLDYFEMDSKETLAKLDQVINELQVVLQLKEAASF